METSLWKKMYPYENKFLLFLQGVIDRVSTEG